MISGTVLFQSCVKDDFEAEILENTSDQEQNTKELTSDSFLQHTQITLGSRLKNPYSVPYMQEAFDYYNAVIPESPFHNRIVRPTHLYVKFTPSSEEHLVYLDSLDNNPDHPDIVLHDFPLDHEVVSEGDYLFMPVDENDLYTDIYTTVPVDFNLPENVPYEILDYLYQPTLEEIEIETVALVKAGWQEDITRDYGAPITEEELPQFLSRTKDAEARAAKFRPQGRVVIINTQTNLEDPLRRAKISIGRGIWWRYVYTDENGNFRSNKRYRGKVRIRAKWRGLETSVRRTFNEILGVQVSDHLMTLRRSNNNRTRVIRLENDHLWYKGTVHNGVITYNDFVNETNIGFPHKTSVVWAWKNGDSSSAPMLHQYPYLPQLSIITGYSQGAIFGVITSGLIGIVSVVARPDLVLQGLEGDVVNGVPNTNRIEQLVFHESGHYTHARKIGALAYARIFSAEINNQIAHGDPYNDGTTPTNAAGETIALAEGWATYIEWKACERMNNLGFNGQNFINPQTYMDAFEMYSRPMNLDLDGDGDDLDLEDNRSFFLTGLLWHLQDQENGVNQDGRNFRNGLTTGIIGLLVDQVGIASDGNLAPMIELLESDIKSGFDLKQRVIDLHPAGEQRINDLFESYGY